MHTVIGKALDFNICFRPITLTAHAGIVLLRDFISKLELPARIDAQIKVKARERGYPESENVLNLCWNAITGGHCLRDLAVMRGDPGLTELLGVRSILAPQTAGEFLRQFDIGDLSDMRRLHGLVAERVSLAGGRQSRRVTIDLDASLYEQCSQRKQGSRMNYKGDVGYYPIFAFWAEEKELLATHLLRGNAHAAPRALWLLRQALANVPAGRKLYLRADSEFYCWKLIEFCEQQQITYAISADRTKELQARIAALPESAWKYYGPGRVQVSELWFAPARRAKHRYVVKRQPVRDKSGEIVWRYHVVITNDEHRGAKKLMSWALGRCAMENLIKEHKNDFGFEKMPSQRFHANWAWLLLSQLAWNIVAWFNRYCLPAICHTMTLGTLRHRLLNVAGRIVHSGRQKFLVLSEENLFKDWWSFALKQLAVLSWCRP